MKNILPCFVLVALLVACGDHAGDFSADYLDSNPVQIGDESQDKDSVDVEVVASEEDIPNCTSTREGGVFYVAELEQKFVCRDGEWVEYEPDSDEGEECGEDECEASEKSSSSKRRRSSSSTEDEEDDGDGDFEEDEDNDESSDSGEDPVSSSSREKGKSNSSAVSPTGAIGGICVASDSVIEKGESVQWSYKRIGPVIPSTYSWTFEDGSIASSQDSLPAPVTYVTAGIHGVTLVLDKGKEHEELRTCSVRVHGTPVTSCECTSNVSGNYVVLPDDDEVTVTWSVSGCEGAAPFTYSWGGVAAGTSTSSTVAFSTTGNFAPTVRVENSQAEHVNITCSSVTVVLPISGICGLDKASYGTGMNPVTAKPGETWYFIGPRSISGWNTSVYGSNPLSMSLEGEGVNKTVSIPYYGSTSYLSTIVAPTAPGTYVYKVKYLDSDVCSTTMTVVGSSSSSSVIASSSSANESSSSEAVAEVKSAGYYENHCPAGHTCKDAAPSTYLKSGITYGEILDTRDDQVYKVVTIGDQTWMAQNLNYAPDEDYVSTLGSYAWSGCYNNSADSCAKYGRLYTWEVAMDKAGCGYGESCNNSYKGTQGICPSGWHLPTYAEWDTFFTNVGGENVAGRMLKSEEGWNYYSESTKGIDYYGFSALPAGYRYDYGHFDYAGYYAYFWSSSEDYSFNAFSMYLLYYVENAELHGYSKNYAFSVRCLKD
ncbi:MAG: fibrobacter succinogenes major paralogous domain-containing protein [Fibrobacter sp.]|nr:fibrobacter succinogenes major paralogous domain-containing protein [Fibrobacter sp.]